MKKKKDEEDLKKTRSNDGTDGRRGSKTSAQIAYFRPGTIRLGLYGPYEVLARVTLQTDILYACDSPSIMITPS